MKGEKESEVEEEKEKREGKGGGERAETTKKTKKFGGIKRQRRMRRKQEREKQKAVAGLSLNKKGERELQAPGFGGLQQGSDSERGRAFLLELGCWSTSLTTERVVGLIPKESSSVDNCIYFSVFTL